MKLATFSAALAAGLMLAGTASADEGLWTFDNFPAAAVKAKYGVDITPAWLAQVQGAAVRLSIGCSASEVSPNGLLLTNNHCVSDCTHDLSTPEQDVFGSGFLAAARSDEQTCPGLTAEVLVGVTDVTRLMSGAGAGLSGAALVQARNAMAAGLEQGVCGADRKFDCEVETLYRGGVYKLYKYHQYTDVRLVFAPGDAVGNFGGDPDNFNFPRYDLDCAFLRLYEDSKPVATPGSLRWNTAPPAAGEPVFVPGNPGGTFREQTVAELEAQRQVALPMEMALRAERRGRIIEFIEQSPANAHMAAEALDELENDYKVTVGHLAALDDPAFMDGKRAAEADLKAKARTLLGPGFGDPWADMDRAQAAYAALYVPYRQIEIGPRDSDLFEYARRLVRAGIERGKPGAQRLPGYAENQLPILQRQVLDAKPVALPLEQLELEFWLSKSRELLTADDPDTRLLLGMDSPETLSKRLVTGTRLGDPAVRKALWNGGLAAVQASDDPMIELALKLDPEARRIRAAFEEQVQGPAARAAEAIAKARFAVYGEQVYPDGNFSLRLSYGDVEGWTYRGKTVTPFTNFAGLYARATGQPPFGLDPRWAAAQSRLNPATIFNFSTNNDIIGGNSGSPVLNARAEVIGTAFDGNILSIGGDYGYDPATNRAVAVTAGAISEALRKVYGAAALADELAGS
jgi:hypothetical protein